MENSNRIPNPPGLTKEEIKPLFEDLQGHTQDDASFQKVMAKQKETAQKIADSKK